MQAGHGAHAAVGRGQVFTVLDGAQVQLTGLGQPGGHCHEADPALDDLTVTAEMISMAQLGLAAAGAVSNDPAIGQLAQALNGIEPGTDPSVAKVVLPSNFRNALNGFASGTFKYLSLFCGFFISWLKQNRRYVSNDFVFFFQKEQFRRIFGYKK